MSNRAMIERRYRFTEVKHTRWMRTAMKRMRHIQNCGDAYDARMGGFIIQKIHNGSKP